MQAAPATCASPCAEGAMADFVLISVMHDRFCTQFTQCEFRVLSLYYCIVNALLAGLPSRSFRRYHILPFAARESTRSSARCHRPTSPLIFQTRALARNTASAHHVRSSHAETSPARLPERRTHPRPRRAHVRAAGLPRGVSWAAAATMRTGPARL